MYAQGYPKQSGSYTIWAHFFKSPHSSVIVHSTKSAPENYAWTRIVRMQNRETYIKT